MFFVFWGNDMKANLFLLIVFYISAASAQPWHVNILWERQGLEDSSGYGGIIALGDQNDDGYADWAVSAYPPYNPTDSAYVEFFLGGDPPSTEPYMTYRESTLDSGVFGGTWAIGDINGDGYQDWYTRVGYYSPWGWFEAQIFYGGPDADLIPDVLWHFHWQTDDEQFHWIGDFNGDGFEDLYKWRRVNEAGYACFGSTTFDTIPDWTRHAPLDAVYQTYPEGYGDVNNDGFSDFVSHSYEPTSRLFVFWGSAQPDTLPGLTVIGFENEEIRVVNDLNLDGQDDIVAISPFQIAVHWGGSNLSPSPNAILGFPCDFPTMVAAVGSVNGDAFGDFIAVDTNCGVLSLYLGNYQIGPQPAWTLYDRGGPPYLVGIGVAARLGDINGDGINDFGIGASNSDNDGTRGRCVILSGDTTVHVAADEPGSTFADKFGFQVHPNPFNSSTRISFSLPRPAHAALNIVAITGREVRVLFDHEMPAGEQQVNFDAHDLPSGIYFARLRAGELSRTQKMVLLR